MIQFLSGGQTGVDRAALDAALELGWPLGGFCPKGRLAEDGPIAAFYPLTEVQGGYAERTRANVQESPATVILHHGPMKGGTMLTAKIARSENKPLLLVDAKKHSAKEGAALLAQWHAELGFEAYNFAGPRASGWPGAYEYTKALLKHFARLI